MYSFVYEESETWAIWPTDISLSAFNGSSSDIVIEQIFCQLFDEVQAKMTDVQLKMQNEKSQLMVKMNQLLAFFEDYRTNAQINEVFVRYCRYT